MPIFFDKISGQIIQVDNFAMRLGRMRRKIKAWTKFLDRSQEYDYFHVILTYARDNWQPNDIRNFIKTVKRYYKRKLIAYAWVMETQKRGVAHYHMLLVMAKGTKMRFPDKMGWWLRGSSAVRRRFVSNYIISDLGKEYQKENLPPGARMFAVWACKDKKNNEWDLVRLESMPGYVRHLVRKAYDLTGTISKFKKNTGAGYWVDDQLIESDFIFLGF